MIRSDGKNKKGKQIMRKRKDKGVEDVECSVECGRITIGLARGNDEEMDGVGVNRFRMPCRFYEINLFFLSPPLSNQDNNKQEAAPPVCE